MSIGYAYHGDLESVQRTIDEMRSQRVYAGHSMYVEMLDALSRGGQSSRMKEVLQAILTQFSNILNLYSITSY